MSELVTVGQLEVFLRREFTAAEEDTAQQLLDGAEDLVREYCGWHIAPSRAETLTVDGSGGPVQPLPTLWLTGVTAVTEVGTALTVADLDWSTYGVLEKQAGGLWTSRRRGVVAQVSHGFDEAPKWLVTLLCASAGRAFTAAVGVVQESAGGESVTYAQPTPGAGGSVLLLDVERRMLDRIALPSRP